MGACIQSYLGVNYLGVNYFSVWLASRQACWQHWPADLVYPLISSTDERHDEFIGALEALGGSAGNGRLREMLEWGEASYEAVMADLLSRRLIVAGRNMGKTNPVNDADLAEFIALQKTKADSAKSWSVDVATIDPRTFDLSVKNPNGGEEITHRSPQEIMDEIAALEAESAEVLGNINALL